MNRPSIQKLKKRKNLETSGPFGSVNICTPWNKLNVINNIALFLFKRFRVYKNYKTLSFSFLPNDCAISELIMGFIISKQSQVRAHFQRQNYRRTQTHNAMQLLSIR